jgi:hypothetical protein
MKCSYTRVGGGGVGDGVGGGGGRRGRRRRSRGRRRRRRRGRRGRNRRRYVADDDDLFLGNPLNVGAHALGDDANRNDDRTLVNLGRNVERARFAVDDDFGFTDRYLDVGTGLRDVGRLRSGIVGDRRTHLFEHGAQRDEDFVAAHECGENPVVTVTIGFGIDVVIVEEDRDFARRGRAEIRRRHRGRLGNANGLQVGRVALQFGL